MIKSDPSFAYAVVDDWFSSYLGFQPGSKAIDCGRLGLEPESVLMNST